MAALELPSGRPSPTATNGPHSRQGFLSGDARLQQSGVVQTPLSSARCAAAWFAHLLCYAGFEKVVLGQSLERVRMSRPAYGAATSHVERYGALQERKLLRKIASVMQFGSLVVEG
jgi:hypothetical protein